MALFESVFQNKRWGCCGQPRCRLLREENPWRKRLSCGTGLNDLAKTRVAIISQHARHSVSGTMFRCWRCMHWFRQCTATIHSACVLKPQPNTRDVVRRKSSVRRQSAAKGGYSSEQPPLAASLPAKEADAHHCATAIHLPTESSITECRSTSRILKLLSSFVPAIRLRHHSQSADGSRLPCRAQFSALVCAVVMSEPSRRPPFALPHEFYSSHAPTLRLLGVTMSRLLPHGRPDHAPSCQTRRP